MIRLKIIMSVALESNSHGRIHPVRDFGGNKNITKLGRTGAIFRLAFKASRSPPVSMRSLLEEPLKNIFVLSSDFIRLTISSSTRSVSSE